MKFPCSPPPPEKNPEHTRVGWKLHRLTMMQLSNLTKCGLYFNTVPPAVHTLLPSVLQRLDSWYRSSHPDPRKSPQLQIWPHYRSDTASQWQRSVFSCWGTENSQMVPKSGEYGGWSTGSKPQSRTTAIVTTDLYARALSYSEAGLPSLIIQAVHEMSLVLLFKVCITSPVWVYLKGNNAVSTRMLRFIALAFELFSPPS